VLSPLLSVLLLSSPKEKGVRRKEQGERSKEKGARRKEQGERSLLYSLWVFFFSPCFANQRGGVRSKGKERVALFFKNPLVLSPSPLLTPLVCKAKE